MEEDATFPAEPTLDALMVLIAELHRAGLFDAANLASMKRRLELSGHADLAGRIAAIPFANAIDTPAHIRASLQVVDGGNAPD